MEGQVLVTATSQGAGVLQAHQKGTLSHEAYEQMLDDIDRRSLESAGDA